MKSLNVIKYSKIWFSVSGALIVLSILSVLVFGLRWGIDFTGGSLFDLDFEQDVAPATVVSVLAEASYSAVAQQSDTGIIIRSTPLEPVQHEEIIVLLEERLGAFEELQFDSVGPAIGNELKRSAIGAIVLLLILIVLYVAWTFRKISEPVSSWKYGLLTIFAAIHDIIIPIGAFAIFGHFYGYEINTAFVAAILTVMGYSINDTIVVFDRTRENLVNERHSEKPFAEIVNKSVVQSFSRSINTSFTTIIVLLAVYFFGGETTRPFVLTLIIGIVAGTYSSIFIGSPLLVLWEKVKINK